MNNELEPIRKGMQQHGISVADFKEFKGNITLDELLNRKIHLKLRGLPQRFILSIDPFYIQEFTNLKAYSFYELLYSFFGYGGREDVPESIQLKFRKQFEGYECKDASFTHSRFLGIYLLSYLFFHLSRYKMDAWIQLLESDKKLISFFIKYFLKYSKVQFLRDYSLGLI